MLQCCHGFVAGRSVNSEQRLNQGLVVGVDEEDDGLARGLAHTIRLGNHDAVPGGGVEAVR